MTFKKLATLVIACLFSGAVSAATLLPNGMQTFSDANGVPLVGGSVTFYIPNTSTPKATYRDSGQTIVNSNPVVLDSAGRAIIYGSGSYREVVKDASGNLIYDQLTADTSSSQLSWGGTSTGSANSQSVTANNFTSSDGQLVAFIAGYTNTSALSVLINSNPINVLKDTATGSLTLTGGEVVAGNVVTVVYDARLGAFHLVAYPTSTAPLVNLASATTTDLGSVPSRNVNVTGTTTITSFGASASTNFPFYRVKFAGALTLTYNATSLLMPGNANITTAAGDYADVLYLGSGNWQIVNYQAASAYPILYPPAAASASGLLLTNDATTPNTKFDITVSNAVLTNSIGTPYYWTGGTVVCNLSATGANGIDTGSKANSTWYNAYLIANPSTATVSCLASVSATAPTLPSGYTNMVRVGAMYVGSGGSLATTIQYGRSAQYIAASASYTAIPVIASGSGSGSFTVTTAVPPTAYEINVTLGNPSNQSITPDGASASAGPSSFRGNGNTPALQVSYRQYGDFISVSGRFVLESTTFYYSSTASQFFLWCNGWTDRVNAN